MVVGLVELMTHLGSIGINKNQKCNTGELVRFYSVIFIPRMREAASLMETGHSACLKNKQ